MLRKTTFDQKIRHAVEADPKFGAEGGKVWDQVAAAYKNWTPYEKPNPQAAAEAFVKSSHLQNEVERRRLAANHDALTASEDGMIKLALLLEPARQRIEKKHAETIGTPEISAGVRIAHYRYLLFGDTQYPDANGTQRVEFGVIKSYTDRAGVNQPYAATFSGLYYRQNNRGPYLVPQRWIEAKPILDQVTPLDFVSTCDIGGGDSGSPTVNRAGELTGVIFDGNLESLPNSYLYTDEQARAVYVAAEEIAEALKKVYRAEALLWELGVTVDGGTAN